MLFLHANAVLHFDNFICIRQFVKRLNGEIDWRLSELLKVAAICGCTIDDLVGREGGQ